MYNRHPPELGISDHEREILQRLENKTVYLNLFQKAFAGHRKKISFVEIKKAIAAFVASIKSTNSRYDQFVAGAKEVLSSDEQKGMQLFFSEKLHCSKCHGGLNFDSPTVLNNAGNKEFYFNTGIYNTDGNGGYPLSDRGLMEKTKKLQDMGKFKVPTLRNLFFTAPYYHDGSANTLTEVLHDYDRGGRFIQTGANKGDGAANHFKHPLIQPLHLSTIEKSHLLLFLNTLTDTGLTINPVYQIPQPFNQ
jgi:cytochrome c peroxidase